MTRGVNRAILALGLGNPGRQWASVRTEAFCFQGKTFKLLRPIGRANRSASWSPLQLILLSASVIWKGRRSRGILEAGALDEAAERIQRRIGGPRDLWPVPSQDFLQAFYAALRGRLEQKLLFGEISPG